MGCKDCDEAQESNSVYYYRWKNANIELSGCKNHIKEIFKKLNNQEVKMAEEEKSEEDSATPEEADEVSDEESKEEESESSEETKEE